MNKCELSTSDSEDAVHGVEYNVERCNDAIHAIHALSKALLLLWGSIPSPERSAQRALVVIYAKRMTHATTYVNCHTPKRTPSTSWSGVFPGRVQVATV